jgi:ubiquinone biosynthesis protein
MGEARKGGAAPPPKSRDKQSSRLHEIVEILRRNDIIHGVTPQKLPKMLEELGPTFVKLGQIMSMRSDMLPQAYCDELKKLRTEVAPMPFETVKDILTQQYNKPPEEVFVYIDEKPLGSASVAQVHAARLHSGEEVVIKVQRQGIHQIMEEDLAIMRRAAKLLRIVPAAGDVIDFNGLLDEFWTVSQQEMNFLMEAEHLEHFAQCNDAVSYATCPKVYRNLSTATVLVMERIEGIPIDHLDALREGGYDIEEIGAKLADNYIKQILDDGFFHADPHPGNLVIRGGQIVWLDLGMIGVLSNRDRQLFRTAMMAVARQDIYELENAIMSIGVLKGKVNHNELYEDIRIFVDRYGKSDLQDLNLGQVLSEMMELAAKHHIGLPNSITMLVRGVMTIEGVLDDCSPTTSLMEIVSNHFSMSHFTMSSAEHELHHLLRKFTGSVEKISDIPLNIADIIKMTVRGQTKINLELTGSEEPLSKIDRMVDRLIFGIIDGALLIGSSMLCTTDMEPKVLGIPALGFLGFLIAFVLSGALLFDIFRKRRYR